LRGDNTRKFERCCNKEERKRVMARGRKREIFSKGERKKYSIEGTECAHPWDVLQ